MEIKHWEGREIDQALIDHLLASALHCPPKPGMSSGLKRAYAQSKRLGVCFITHVWLAYASEGAVGVAVMENNPDTCVEVFRLQVYVKDAWRHLGIGRKLVQHAIDTGETFGAYYTPTSAGLYRHFGLTNLTKEPATIYDLAS